MIIADPLPSTGRQHHRNIRNFVCVQSNRNLTMIVKIGGKYYVVSKKKPHKRLSKGYESKKEAVKRLQQIEYFKHRT